MAKKCPHPEKVKYANKKAAWKQSLYFYTHFGSYNKAYICPCGLYHLSGKYGLLRFDPPKEWLKEFEQWAGFSFDLHEH